MCLLARYKYVQRALARLPESPLARERTLPCALFSRTARFVEVHVISNFRSRRQYASLTGSCLLIASLFAHDQYWAVSVPSYRVGDAAYQRSPNPSETSAPHHH